MQSIRILIANQQPIVRSGLRFLLERQSGFQVVAEGANGREAIVLSEFCHPDIALLEIKLPLVNGIEVAKQLSTRDKAPKLLFVSAQTDEGYVVEAFKAGARGYVASDSAITDLPRAIRLVSAGRAYLSPAICSQFLDRQLTNVSDRARELYCLLAAGYDDSEIAGILGTDVDDIRADRLSCQNLSLHDFLPEAIAQAVLTANCQ